MDHFPNDTFSIDKFVKNISFHFLARHFRTKKNYPHSQ